MEAHDTSCCQLRKRGYFCSIALNYYSWENRPRPESPGLYAAVGHIAINGEFSAAGRTVWCRSGHVVSYVARYFIDETERYEWFPGTVTHFGNIQIPHKWALALRDASPPRAREYDVTGTFEEKGRILLQKHSWRKLAWWEP